MVVPLFLPDAERGNSGELVGLFNNRPFRRFVLANIIDKIVGQSRFYRRHILRRLDRADYLQRVDMEVGNLTCLGLPQLARQYAVQIRCLASHPPPAFRPFARLQRSVDSRRTAWAVAAQSGPKTYRRSRPRRLLTAGIETV